MCIQLLSSNAFLAFERRDADGCSDSHRIMVHMVISDETGEVIDMTTEF